jgi:3-hydroxyisobutyrate dehydrogenase
MAKPLDTVKAIGFIGLGVMGYPMACLLAKNLPSDTRLFVFDVAESQLKKIQSKYPDRIIVSKNSKEVTESSEIVLTMVPEGIHVKAVYLDAENGVLQGDIEKKILVDMSTIDTETSLLVKDEIEKKSPSTAFYDAPVSGGSLGAAKGTLTFMLGAAETDPNLPLLKELLGIMGSKVFPCGGPSLGLTAKLSNNYLSGLCAIATAEAMNIGMRAGLDPRVLSSIFSASTAQNRIQETWNPVPGVCPDAPSSKGYEGGFKIQLMKKDFGLAVQTAERVGAKLVLGDIGLKTYTDASEDPQCRDRDSRVVYRYLGGREDWQQGGDK